MFLNAYTCRLHAHYTDTKYTAHIHPQTIIKPTETTINKRVMPKIPEKKSCRLLV